MTEESDLAAIFSKKSHPRISGWRFIEFITLADLSEQQ